LFFILLINLQKNKTNKLFPCHKQTLKNIFQLFQHETSFKLNKFRSFPFISNIKDKSKSNTTQNLSQQKTSCRSSLKTLDDETNGSIP
jgi:gas vesicle protein